LSNVYLILEIYVLLGLYQVYLIFSISQRRCDAPMRGPAD